VKRNLILTYLIGLLATSTAVSQSLSPMLTATTGNFMSTSNYSLSYTVGELSVSYDLNSSYLLTKGFQQADPSSGNYEPDIQLIAVNPNPVATKLYIDFYISGTNDFRIEVYNLKGTQVMTFLYPETVYKDQKIIDFESLPKGLYLIRIYSVNGKISERYKIEKM
jgi:hypothetical protein